MLRQGAGAIVNASSMSGLIGAPEVPAYSTSKNGVVGLTRTAVLAYAKHCIRVNAVAPEWIAVAAADARSQARDIGTLPSVRVDWRISRHLTYTAIYSHFFAGRFLKETPPGEDVDYISTWLTFRF
jgi:NAD(P)-dependent dehydrogenase (short-subunit alcohol dehydrogenase family)